MAGGLEILYSAQLLNCALLMISTSLAFAVEGLCRTGECRLAQTYHTSKPWFAWLGVLLRKEVIQPQVPLRLPCYDFTPVANPTVVACLLAVSAAPSGETNSHGVTGGVYKAWERIHRGMLIRDY